MPSDKRRADPAMPATAVDDESELRVLVADLARRLDEHVRAAVGELGVTTSQGVALRELSRPLTMRELAERMSCEPSNTTYVIDKLEQAGLVERLPHPTDRRAKVLALTAEGTALRTQALARLADGSPLARLSPAQQDSLADLLRRALGRPGA